MKLKNWDTFYHVSRPYGVVQPTTFINDAHFTTPHHIRELYSVAEDCPRHTFLINVEEESAWYGVPDNVIPVFNYPNIVGRHFDKWLERCEYTGPKVVRIFCQTKYAPDLLKHCDWVLLHSFNMAPMKGVLDRLLKMGVPTYVHKYQNSTKLPVEVRCRQVPTIVKKHLHSVCFV